MTPNHFALAVFLSFISAYSQSFEGYIELGYLNVAPLWMELKIPASEGPVTGTYFYRKVGKAISLKGESKGNTLSLTEFDAKNNVTGIFTCTSIGDSLLGTWKAPKAAQPKVVKLFKANPADKQFARMPGFGEFKLKSGKTLAQEMRENKYGDKLKPDYSKIIFYRKNILSLEYGWETMGAYPGSYSFVHSFDLSTHREIELDKEIDSKQLSAFNAFLSRKIQSEMTQHRKAYSDSEWYAALSERIKDGPDGEDDGLDEYFDVGNGFTAGSSEFFFTETGLHYRVQNYFEFPHAMQGMDFNSDILIPFSQLKLFLRKGSVLRRLLP